jgi:hypothetical protein
MMFYAISLDVCSPDDFEAEAVEIDARSPEDAAEQIPVFEDPDDGRTCKVMIADNPEGKDARTFIVTQRVRVSYEVREVIAKE